MGPTLSPVGLLIRLVTMMMRNHQEQLSVDVAINSVPLIRPPPPPILYTTSSLKWGEGLCSNMQLVSNISPPPPPPPQKVLRDCYVHFQSSCLHKNTVTKAFYTKQLIQTDTDREYCSWTSRLQSFVVSLHRRRVASSMRGQ